MEEQKKAPRGFGGEKYHLNGHAHGTNEFLCLSCKEKAQQEDGAFEIRLHTSFGLKAEEITRTRTIWCPACKKITKHRWQDFHEFSRGHS